MRNPLRGNLLVAILCLAVGLPGCTVLPRKVVRGSSSEDLPNPFFVAGNQDEVVWERTVDVIHDYFEIGRENRLDGVIETQPKVGASLLEPWHRDSVGAANRLESSLQSIRRRAFVTITPTDGGYLVGVEVMKELHDAPGRMGGAVGGATFQKNQALQRDLDLGSDIAGSTGWISEGRDALLEQRMLRALQASFRK